MALTLTPHPDTKLPAFDRIEVETSRLGGHLWLHYALMGGIDAIDGLADDDGALAGERRDELWKRTCLECFLKPADGDAYVELNVSPETGDWAAYGFTGYRETMTNAEMAPPQIRCHRQPGLFTLSVQIALPDIIAPSARLACGLTAVIQPQKGATQYWALAHPPGKPDFHHDAGLAHDLPPSELT